MSSSVTEARRWSAEADSQGGSAFARATLLLFSAGVAIDQLEIPGYPGIIVAIRAAGLILMAGGLHAMVRTRTWRAAPAPLLAMLGFTIWSCASMLWAHDVERSVDRALTNVQLMIFLLLAWQIARSRLDLRAAMAGFVLGCGILALGAWKSYLQGITYDEARYGPGLDYEDLRFAALGFDPNDMGLILAMGVPLAGYLALAGRGGLRRLWIVYLPLAVSAIALSGSRGSSMAAGIAVCSVLWWMRRREPKVFGAVLVLLGIGMAVVWFRTPETWERIFTARQELTGGTLTMRTSIWRAGWGLFVQNPIAGIGIGGFLGEVAKGLGYQIVAHNTPLSVAAELGLIGLFLFYAAPVLVLWRMWRVGREEWALVAGIFLTWFVGTASLSWEHRKPTWLLMFLGAVWCELRRDDGPGVTP